MVSLRGNKKLLFILVACWSVIMHAVVKAPLQLEVTDMNDQIITDVLIDDQFVVKIIIDDASIVKGEPYLVTNDKVEAHRVRVSYKQINRKTSYEYMYIARAMHPGVAQIGPVTIETNQGTYKSSIMTINVVESDKDFKQVKVSQKPDVWITLTVDNEHVLVGQEINATLSLYAVQEPHSITNLDIPAINGLVRVGAAVSKQGRTVIDGKTYYLLETKWRWVAEQEGTIMVPAVMLSCTMAVKSQGWFSLWQLDTKQLHSNRLHLTVNPLPPYTGTDELIGVGHNVTISASVDKDTIPLKDALVYSIVLSGSNGVEQIAQMHLTHMSNEWKIYPSTVSVVEDKKLSSSNNNVVIKKFDYVLQSMKPGTVVIPAQTYSYFDLIDNKYKTLITQPLNIHVEGCIEQKVATSLEVTDVAPVVNVDQGNCTVVIPCNERGAWYATRLVWVISWQLFFLLWFLPLWCMGGMGLYDIIYRYWLKNATERNYHNAFSIARKEWQMIRARGDCTELYQLFVRLFAHRYKVFTSQVSHEKIIEWLQERNLSDELIVDFDSFLSYLAACMYGSGFKQKSNTDIFLQAEKWIKQLEKVL